MNRIRISRLAAVFLLMAAPGLLAHAAAKPAWPDSASRCRSDSQCTTGLVCQALTQQMVNDLLTGTPTTEQSTGDPLASPTENGTKMSPGTLVCQPGCRISGAFVEQGAPNGFPNNCESCQPGLSTTSWSPIAAGTVCNAGSGDLCDPDEVCSGASGVCPSDRFASSTTVCNSGTGDLCDPHETCSGVPDQACPVDRFAPAGTVCNAGSGDSCDPHEVCSGTPDQACPAEFFEPTTTVCRAGSGDSCDPEEYCPGTAGVACPADDVTSAGTVCRASGGSCDLEEQCSGVAGDGCPTDDKQPEGFECRSSAGPCDIAEVCDGLSNGCPTNEFESSSVSCRPRSDFCDAEDFCSGTSAECVDDLSPAGTVCRPSNGVCDTDEEVCTGSSKSCPLNTNLINFVCRPSAGPCDVAELCTGSSAPGYPGCPPDEYLVGGTACPLSPSNFPQIQACDAVESCDGTGAECPEDLRLGEGDACTFGGQEGVCGPTVFPHFLGWRECDVPGILADGTPCQSDDECISDHCGETLDAGRLCLPPNTNGLDGAGYGEACDGDGFHFAGDPSLRQCTGLGGEMVCCNGSGLAGIGEVGTCRGCCRDFHQPNPEPGGGSIQIGCTSENATPEKRCVGQNGATIRTCNNNGDCNRGEWCTVMAEPTCCGGRCQETNYNPEACGDCSTNCVAIAEANLCIDVVSCGSGATPGVCNFETTCDESNLASNEFITCAIAGSEAWCNPRFIAGTQEHDDCLAESPAAICTVNEYVSGTTCRDCDSNTDCDLNEICYSKCDYGGGAGSELACLSGGYCAVEPDDCQSAF